MMNMQNTKHMQATIHPLGDSCCDTVLRLHVCAHDKVLTSGNELVKTGALSDNWNPGENCNSDNHQMFHLFAFEGEFIITSPNFRWIDCLNVVSKSV